MVFYKIGIVCSDEQGGSYTVNAFTMDLVPLLTFIRLNAPLSSKQEKFYLFLISMI